MKENQVEAMDDDVTEPKSGEFHTSRPRQATVTTCETGRWMAEPRGISTDLTVMDYDRVAIYPSIHPFIQLSGEVNMT